MQVLTVISVVIEDQPSSSLETDNHQKHSLALPNCLSSSPLFLSLLTSYLSFLPFLTPSLSLTSPCFIAKASLGLPFFHVRFPGAGIAGLHHRVQRLLLFHIARNASLSVSTFNILDL